MTEKELQQAGKLYLLDNELRNAHYNSKRITRLLSATLETEVSRRKELVQELFGSAAADYLRAAELDERKNQVEERLMEIYEELG